SQEKRSGDEKAQKGKPEGNKEAADFCTELDSNGFGHGFSTRFCEKALWAQSENSQEDKVTCEDLVAGVDPRSESLSNAENYSSDQGSPEIAEPANDHRFKSEHQPVRSNRRIKIGANTKENASNRNDCE